MKTVKGFPRCRQAELSDAEYIIYIILIVGDLALMIATLSWMWGGS